MPEAFDQELRVTGACPEPVLKSARALRGMQSGEVLRVVCTDPVSVKDLAAFSAQTGNALLSQETLAEDGQTLYVHFLRRR